MNLFDIIVFAICITSSLMGLHKGLLRCILSFVCFLLSLVATDILFSPVRTVAIEHVNNIVVANIISGVGAYLISMFFFAFVNNQLTGFISGISGGMIDRALGLGLGALRGLIICWIIFGIVAIFTSDAHIGAVTAKDITTKVKPDHYPKWLTSSMSYDFISSSLHSIGSSVSDKTLQSIILPSTAKDLPESHSEIIDKATEIGKEHALERMRETGDDLEKELEGLMRP